MATARNIGELLKLIEQLRREVSRLKTLNGRVEAVEKIAHHYHSRLPGMYRDLDTEDYLLSVLAGDGDLLTMDNGAITNIDPGTLVGRPLLSTGATTAPAFGQVTTAGIAGEAVQGALGTRQIRPGTVGTNDIGAGQITTSLIASGAVNSDKLATGAVTNGKISSGAVNATSLATNAVTEDKILAGAVTANKIGADAVNGSKIADNSIDSEHYVDGSIDAAHLAQSYHLASAFETTRPVAGSVAIKTRAVDGYIDRSFLEPAEQADIASAAITESKLANNAVTAGKIAAGAVDGTKMAASSIDTAQLAADAVTRAKLADPENFENIQTHIIRRSGTWTVGQAIRLYLDTTDNMTRIRVPAGKTLEVLAFAGNMLSGSTAGTYKFRGMVREYTDDQSSSGGMTHWFNDENDWGGSSTSHHYRYFEEWDGTTPLASVTGSATMSVMFGLENHADSPGTTTSENCGMTVIYRIV